MCGLRITMRGEDVLRIRANDDDVFSRGHICPKGTTLGALHADPNRLRAPVVRDPGTDTFREVAGSVRESLGWSNTRMEAECDRYRAMLEATFGFATETA